MILLQNDGKNIGNFHASVCNRGREICPQGSPKPVILTAPSGGTHPLPGPGTASFGACPRKAPAGRHPRMGPARGGQNLPHCAAALSRWERAAPGEQGVRRRPPDMTARWCSSPKPAPSGGRKSRSSCPSNPSSPRSLVWKIFAYVVLFNRPAAGYSVFSSTF